MRSPSFLRLSVETILLNRSWISKFLLETIVAFVIEADIEAVIQQTAYDSTQKQWFRRAEESSHFS